jgi:hypothetical protein
MCARTTICICGFVLILLYIFVLKLVYLSSLTTHTVVYVSWSAPLVQQDVGRCVCVYRFI